MLDSIKEFADSCFENSMGYSGIKITLPEDLYVKLWQELRDTCKYTHEGIPWVNGITLNFAGGPVYVDYK